MKHLTNSQTFTSIAKERNSEKYLKRLPQKPCISSFIYRGYELHAIWLNDNCGVFSCYAFHQLLTMHDHDMLIQLQHWGRPFCCIS